ncbi:MAG: glycosyltransferase family 2 protein, partial [Pseudomonadota bacterium]
RETAPGPAELIVIDNGSTDAETLAFYEALAGDERVRIDMRPAPFNFSAMVNRGAAMAKGEAILLLNNDVEAIEPKWLALMAETLARPRVGIVGAKLLFPDRTIQHAGVIVGHGGVAGHDMKGMAEDAEDPLGRMAVPHQRSAVTAACMLVRREVWEALGGFDEATFPVAFNDVDFCLRARAAGWRVALDPRAVLIHHEGKSRRGFSLSGFLRHRRERGALRLRHGTVGMVDPFENPWRDHDDLKPNVRRPAGPLTMRFQTPARAV